MGETCRAQDCEEENEMKRYADNLEKTCRRKGVPAAKIKEMLENTASLSDEIND